MIPLIKKIINIAMPGRFTAFCLGVCLSIGIIPSINNIHSVNHDHVLIMFAYRLGGYLGIITGSILFILVIALFHYLADRFFKLRRKTANQCEISDTHAPQE